MAFQRAWSVELSVCQRHGESLPKIAEIPKYPHFRNFVPQEIPHQELASTKRVWTQKGKSR
jgi:hypothetical protein